MDLFGLCFRTIDSGGEKPAHTERAGQTPLAEPRKRPLHSFTDQLHSRTEQNHRLCTEADLPCLLRGHQNWFHSWRCVQSPPGQTQATQERTQPKGWWVVRERRGGTGNARRARKRRRRQTTGESEGWRKHIVVSGKYRELPQQCFRESHSYNCFNKTFQTGPEFIPLWNIVFSSLQLFIMQSIRFYFLSFFKWIYLLLLQVTHFLPCL